MATWAEMIPIIRLDRRPRLRSALKALAALAFIGASPIISDRASGAPGPTANSPAPTANAPAPAAAGPTAAPTSPAMPAGTAAAALSGSPLLAPLPPGSKVCLVSGDGYLRARLAGAIETTIDWPNSGTHCEGEPRDKPAGVRLSFRRVHGGKTDLLFVFGITGVQEGKPTHEAGMNLTLIVQGTTHIYATLGDSRCTVDSLTQRRLDKHGLYRIEARGFCTQPAHAVRGDDAVLVSTFEFAGPVTYDLPKD
jgi:hypothetical protein